MCVIFFAFQKHPEYPLILVANRDEFYDRPAEAAANWDDQPTVFAGRDLVAGGTWLGVSKSGKFAAVTNYRERTIGKAVRSRGALTVDFLTGSDSAEIYLEQLQKRKNEYTGFSVLVGEINENQSAVFYFSNRTGTVKKLKSGIYGLSNHLLDTPWPKIQNGKDRFERAIAGSEISENELFKIMTDKMPAVDALLPDTGIGIERERILSSIFIESPGYGTRCSTLMTFDRDYKCSFEERIFV